MAHGRAFHVPPKAIGILNAQNGRVGPLSNQFSDLLIALDCVNLATSTRTRMQSVNADLYGI
jgi:hypothetical protein